MNKYCTKGENQSSHCQRITPLSRRMTQNVPMQCNKDARGLFVKILWLCLLLIDICGSLEILDDISVILRTKKYHTDASLSFSSCTSPGKAKGFINLITK